MEYVLEPEAVKLIMRVLLALAFAGSLFVLIDPEAYKKLNGILMKEFGFKKRLIPSLEEKKVSLDSIILKNRRFFGVIFLVFSFALLTLY